MTVAYTALMKAPLAATPYTAASGNTYTSDANGYIAGVNVGDINGMEAAGCLLLVVTSGDGIPYPIELSLGDAKLPTGAPCAAAAAAGVFGYSVTLGTSYFLVGEATSSNAKTDICLFEFVLPANYKSGSNLTLTVNTNYTGGGTVTAASCTIAAAAYLQSDAGTQGSTLIATAAQQIAATAADYAFVITGTGLIPGQKLILKLTELVTSASGANTGQINSVRIS